MSRWFRWYEGTSEDGKFRVVARLSRVTVRDAIALWAFMLEDASHLDHRGVCNRNEDFMASILDFEDGIVERILESMETVGMISVGHGAITICNFGKRQFDGDSDPTAAERQRRKRERDKSVGNEPVTRDSRLPDTDTDTDKKDIVRANGRAKSETEAITDEFEIWYAAYPLHKGRGAALRGYRTARGKAEPPVLLEAATGFAKKCKGMEAKFIPHPATWLNQERWLDDDLQPSKPLTEANLSAYRVEYGSDEWWAWDADYKARGKNMPNPANGHWTFPSRFPGPNVQHETSSEAA